MTVAVDSGSLTTLQVMRTTAPPALDGDGTDAAWAAAPEVVVHTTRGNGLEGGEVAAHVAALHDGKRAYLLFRWPDATRSPTVKPGWHTGSATTPSCTAFDNAKPMSSRSLCSTLSCCASEATVRFSCA